MSARICRRETRHPFTNVVHENCPNWTVNLTVYTLPDAGTSTRPDR